MPTVISTFTPTRRDFLGATALSTSALMADPLEAREPLNITISRTTGIALAKKVREAEIKKREEYLVLHLSWRTRLVAEILDFISEDENLVKDPKIRKKASELSKWLSGRHDLAFEENRNNTFINIKDKVFFHQLMIDVEQQGLQFIETRFKDNLNYAFKQEPNPNKLTMVTWLRWLNEYNMMACATRDNLLSLTEKDKDGIYPTNYGFKVDDLRFIPISMPQSGTHFHNILELAERIEVQREQQRR